MALEVELVLRLLLSAVLAGAVGLEREISDQPAGFRTHMLVALGACLFAVVSAYGVEGLFDGERPVGVRFDPTRIAAQIVTGIGFLGAGAIIRYGMSVRGLTTAASLWVVAAIGMAVGFGAYLLASVTSVITVLALFGLKRVRGTLVRGLKKEHEEFVLEAGPDLQLEQLVSGIGRHGVRIDRINVEEEEGESLRHILLTVTLSPHQPPEDFVGVLSRTPGVRNVDWTR